jgi:type IV secretory pathway VirB2 component (pilin)
MICSHFLTTSEVAFASVESSLQAVQEKLVGTLLPLGAMCGLAVAGLSFVAGHANARQHLFYAIIGAIVGFGAESIVSLIQSLIH